MPLGVAVVGESEILMPELAAADKPDYIRDTKAGQANEGKAGA